MWWVVCGVAATWRERHPVRSATATPHGGCGVVEDACAGRDYRRGAGDCLPVTIPVPALLVLAFGLLVPVLRLDLQHGTVVDVDGNLGDGPAVGPYLELVDGCAVLSGPTSPTVLAASPVALSRALCSLSDTSRSKMESLLLFNRAAAVAPPASTTPATQSRLRLSMFIGLSLIHSTRAPRNCNLVYESNSGTGV